MTRLPLPEQWMLSRMNDMEVAEMIEEQIDFEYGWPIRSLADAVRAALYAAVRRGAADCGSSGYRTNCSG
jgi:hypothetical protein